MNILNARPKEYFLSFKVSPSNPYEEDPGANEQFMFVKSNLHVSTTFKYIKKYQKVCDKFIIDILLICYLILYLLQDIYEIQRCPQAFPTYVEDHFVLSMFKISRLLNKITGLQVTSPKLNGRVSEIPLAFEAELDLNDAAEDLMVYTRTQ